MLGWASLVGAGALPEHERLPAMRLASTSGLASSGNGPPPALFVSETLPEMVLAPISTPAPLEPRVTFLRVLAPQPSSPGSPRRTKPEAPDTFRLPATVEPHSANGPELVTVRLLLMR